MSNPTPSLKPGKASTIAASIAILSLLSVQAFTAIFHRACSLPIPIICELPKEPGLYPFLDYPMYKTAHYEDAVVDQHAVVATFKDGTEQTLSAEDFSLSPYQFHRGLIVALTDNNTLKIQQYISTYHQSDSPSFVELRLESQPLVITKDGVIDGTKTVINRVAVTTKEAKK